MELQTDPTAALVGAAVLAGAHLVAGAMRFLQGTPRSRWLSAGAGVSVAYVFVHLLPEVAAAQETVAEDASGALPFLEEHAYLLALAGLTLFYGVEWESQRSRRERRQRSGEDRTDAPAFWLSMGSFAVYNGMVGYLLVRGESRTVRGVALFAVALGVHFVVNDAGLREHHREVYDRVGRWLLAGAVLVGWLVGWQTEISEQALALVLAFIAGGVILNVLKEELPGERQARFAPFLAGAIAYAALLQVA